MVSFSSFVPSFPPLCFFGVQRRIMRFVQSLSFGPVHHYITSSLFFSLCFSLFLFHISIPFSWFHPVISISPWLVYVPLCLVGLFLSLFFINRQACIFTWIQWFCDVCYMIRDLEHDLKRYDSHKSISPHAEDRKNPKRTWHGNGNSVKVFVNPYIHRHISVYVHPKYWVRGSGCTFV